MATLTKADLQKKLARLESLHDQLSTEITYVDELLKSIGFPDGLDSAKKVAIEIKEDRIEES